MSDLAIKYRMKKKMAKGGKVNHEKGVNPEHVVAGESEGGPGMSRAGHAARMKHPWAKQEARRVLKELKEMPRPHGEYADGGEVEEAPPEGSSFSKSTGKKISDSFMGETPECEHGSKECEMCHGGMYAKGGKVDRNKHVKGVHKPVSGEGSERYPGMSEAGEDYVDSRLGYGEESPAGGQKATYRKKAKDKHYQVLGEMRAMKKPHGNYADGGQVSTDHDSEGLDMIDHIMQQRAMSKGGQVANDTGDGESADEMENQFDYLVTNDDLNADYTGANSGDELGDAQEDDDRADVVSMIMRSRKKKDRLPSPR